MEITAVILPSCVGPREGGGDLPAWCLYLNMGEPFTDSEPVCLPASGKAHK